MRHEVPIKPFMALVLLWLAGATLRITILAVPPVIPLIHDDLHLSQTQVGILSGIPMVLFAGAAIAGSLLIARFGALNTLIAGLFLCAAGSAVRAVGPHILILYAGTFVTAFGVAVMQPSMPSLVRAWVPQRIAFGTAVFTNGLIVGEIFPAALTIPLVLPWLGQSWQLSLLFWSVPVALVGLLVAIRAPRPATVTHATSVASRGLPNWRDPLLWRIGLMLGGINAVYFSTNAFLPDFLTHTGRPELINAALTALNVGQLPASFMLLLSAERLVRRVWPYLGSGLASLASVLAILFGGDIGVIAGSALFGCFGAAILVLVLALPPIIAAPQDVARTSAGIFTVSYSCAVIVPIISGIIWDLTGSPVAAFIPMVLCCIMTTSLAPTVAVRENTGARGV